MTNIIGSISGVQKVGDLMAIMPNGQFPVLFLQMRSHLENMKSLQTKMARGG